MPCGPALRGGPRRSDRGAVRAGLPGALLSLVFKNADALAMRPALEGRWTGALAAFDATDDVGGLGVPTRAHALSDVTALLEDAGFDVVTWFGIRVFSDHLLDVPVDDLAAVLPAEAEASRRDPYRGLGRLIHVVATRAATAAPGEGRFAAR